jgi:hypothetical protein
MIGILTFDHHDHPANAMKTCGAYLNKEVI